MEVNTLKLFMAKRLNVATNAKVISGHLASLEVENPIQAAELREFYYGKVKQEVQEEVQTEQTEPEEAPKKRGRKPKLSPTE